MQKTLIDTSILTEPFVPWKGNEPNYKERSLLLLKGNLFTFQKKFKPVVSIGIMGEFNLIVNRKPTVVRELNDQKRERMNLIVKNFFDKCEMVGLSKETIEMCNRVLLLDSRIDPLDALHISTAINERCSNFLLIDSTLLNNTKIRKFCKDNGLNLINFGIKENVDNKRPSKSFLLNKG